MNVHAIYHKPESNYCFATSQKQITLRLRFAKGEKLDFVSVLYNNKYRIAQKQLRKELNLAFSDALFDYYSVSLNLNDSRFSYVFEVGVNGKIYYYCEDGLVDNYDFNFAYFNSFQFAYIHKSDVVERVNWLANAVFYQIFVDRFYKASVKNENYITSQWGELPTPKSFYGGDLDGIRQKLPYIKSLGVNAIYLTPIFKSKSNHKYDIYDYYHVDDAFGGDDALKRLVDACHSMNIKIMLDAVFNHVSEDFAPFKQVVKNGKNSKYYNWFVIDGDKISEEKNNYACFAECYDMPKLNTDNAEVQQYCIDVVLYWTKNFGIDGWRLDVSDEVSHEFWRNFRKAIKSVNSECVLIGENWHNSESYLNGEQFDSIMNYAITKQMMDFWVNDSIDAQGLVNRLGQQFSRYNDVTNGMMFNLLDCHDTHRFYTLLNCDKDKFACALAIMIFIPGSYCLYYGDEILTEGGFDPDSRRTFDWDKLKRKETSEFTELVKQLIALKSQPALKDGVIKMYEQSGLFVIERSSDEQTLTLKVCKKAVKVKADGVIKFNTDEMFSNNSFVIEGRLI